MAENIDDKCVQYEASRTLEMSQRAGSDYEKWGCYDCGGFDKACENYVPLGEVKYPTDD